MQKHPELSQSFPEHAQATISPTNPQLIPKAAKTAKAANPKPSEMEGSRSHKAA
jgi:hypothetical protein